MEQKDKDLLLKDFCARLPYGVICNTPKGNGHLNSINQTIFGIELGININAVHRDTFKLEECKPYLRPMSSMTDVEVQIYETLLGGFAIEHAVQLIDWLNRKMFDYRGLIPLGFALEASKGKEE